MMSQPIRLFWVDWLNVKLLDFWLVGTSIWLVDQEFGYSVQHLVSQPAAQQPKSFMAGVGWVGDLTHYVVTSNLKLSWDVTITNSVFWKNSSNRLSEDDLLLYIFNILVGIRWHCFKSYCWKTKWKWKLLLALFIEVKNNIRRAFKPPNLSKMGVI